MDDYLFSKEYRKYVSSCSTNGSYLTTQDIKAHWDNFVSINSEKEIVGEQNTKNVLLAKQYIMEYYFYSLAVGSALEADMFIFRYMFVNIANTAFTIYKLAFDGMDYQAKVLMRNLYELCMTLLNIVIDSEKRIALWESAKNQTEYSTWRKFFSPSAMRKTLEEYHGEKWMDEWHRELYSNLSAYVHNEYGSMLGFASAIARNADVIQTNFCGAYVTRSESLMKEMNTIFFYTGMVFINALSEKEVSISAEMLCKETDVQKNFDNKELWNAACFLEFLNRECYAAIAKEAE